MEIFPGTKEEMGPAWQRIIGDRQLQSCVVADFGLADANVALMAFKVEGSTETFEHEVKVHGVTVKTVEVEVEAFEYEVGHGECMRPYRKLYSGDDLMIASTVWLQHIWQLSGLPSPRYDKEE